MKNTTIKKVVSSVIALCLCMNLTCMCYMASAEDSAGKYNYMLTPNSDSAYMLFGDKCVGKSCTFYDGIEKGITSRNDPLYNEKINIDGVDARYFYNTNHGYLKFDNDFYEKGDHEFLVTIMYYDFGPGKGYFHFEYGSDTGETKRVSLVKTGKVQAWFLKTAYVNDMDLDRCFNNGANMRLLSNVYNAFKKVEIINLSKLKREKKAVGDARLSSETKLLMQELGMIDSSDESFADRNLSNNCSPKSAWSFIKKIKRNEAEKVPSAYAEQDTITQGNLLKLYMDELGISYGNDVIEDAYKCNLIDTGCLFFEEGAPASVYNLIELMYRSLYYKPEQKQSLMFNLIANGYFDNVDVTTITDPQFMNAWFRKPKKCPKQVVRDNETGKTFYYMNINGQPAWRPYVTMQTWSSDGKSFITGLESGPMFMYNIETEMLTYIDNVSTYAGRMHATMGVDDNIYYIKKENNSYSMWKADIHTQETKKLCDAPRGIVISGISVSNDCNYIGVDYVDPSGVYYPNEVRLMARYVIDEDKWEVYTQTFDYCNNLTHTQVNPEYTDLMFFCHELTSGLPADIIYDRVWTIDCKTGAKSNIFKQGLREEVSGFRTEYKGTAYQTATHEVWSNNGEYLYLISPYMWSAEMVGKAPSAVRIDKDGRHRQYYATPNLKYVHTHIYPSGDDKYVVTDGDFLTLISCETSEVIPIVRWESRAEDHPYQPHPVVARNRYIVNWGMRHNGVLGVMWWDFTETAKNDFSKGGRYEVNESLDRVSYKNLDCYSYETKMAGKECTYGKPGGSIYYDIKENVVDTVNGSVKISFDYYDNTKEPLEIIYTLGVNNDNDYWKYDNAKKIIKRNKTKKWQHAEIIIESGNFENAGTYSTDFKISGKTASTYICNIKAERNN